MSPRSLWSSMFLVRRPDPTSLKHFLPGLNEQLIECFTTFVVLFSFGKGMEDQEDEIGSGRMMMERKPHPAYSVLRVERQTALRGIGRV